MSPQQNKTKKLIQQKVWWGLINKKGNLEVVFDSKRDAKYNLWEGDTIVKVKCTIIKK